MFGVNSAEVGFTSSAHKKNEVALIFQSSPRGTVVTRHKLQDGKIGLGHFISKSSLKGFLTECINENGASNQPEILPENILLDNDVKLIWYVKSSLRTMWFKNVAFEVKWTPLVFVANKLNGNLSIFSLATNSRPNLNSVVYHAPLMNISDNGSLCFGTATKPKQVSISSIEDYEKAVFNTKFSHLNGSSFRCKALTNDSHIKFWQKKSESKDKVFASEMVRFGLFSNIVNEVC